MTTLTATEARSNLYKLLDKAAQLHEPIQITGKRNNAVLIAEDDWRAIKETLYLLSIQSSPPFEKLVGDLEGAYSRKINIQHRLVYQVLKRYKTVKVIRVWTHYE